MIPYCPTLFPDAQTCDFTTHPHTLPETGFISDRFSEIKIGKTSHSLLRTAVLL